MSKIATLTCLLETKSISLETRNDKTVQKLVRKPY